MSDRRLQVFNAAAKHLSFTKAAEALFMTQPAVTSQIRHLEEELNTRLFDRAQGRITLTFAGTLALEYADRILALSAELDSTHEGVERTFRRPAVDWREHDNRRLPAASDSRRVQGTLSAGRYAALRCQLGILL